MKINYYPDVNSLYIHLSDKASVDSQEISEGVVADYDELGNLVCFALQDKIEPALELLEKSINLDNKYCEITKTDSDFDSIRNDPRFQALIQ